jgi:predicted lipid-binding transport protein (Tim44 family)
VGLSRFFGGAARARTDRERRVRLAAAEAAEDDPLFAPELVVARATALFVAIQAAWSRNDVAGLRPLVGAELLLEWETRLRDFARKGWRNEVDILEGPDADYVGLVNRAGTAEDQVVVLIRARVQDVVIDRHGSVLPSDEGAIARISEYWTLGRRDTDWVLVSVEQEREGRHQLAAPLIAAPEGDQERIRSEAVMELATADGLRADEATDLLSPAFSGTARAAALDLSLVDPRFGPDVLATAVEEILGAWSQAIDGPDGPLAVLTTPGALQALLFPSGPQARLVIRGAHITENVIVSVSTGPPPTVQLQLTVTGVQYLEDRSTTEVLAGSNRRPTTTRQAWTLRLTDDPRHPWQVTAVTGLAPGHR